MQARSKIYRIFVVALIASLVVSACGGGTSGSTWFNLPSAPIHVQADGSARAFGLNIGALLPQATVQQLQSANIRKLEVRIGYHGVFVLANGQSLPYLSWDADAVTTLQDVLRRAPGVPNANLIANALPWLRRIGLGVAINLPGAGGAIPRWSGETTVATEQPASVIGPFQLGGIVFDQGGNLSIGSVPGSALGLAGPLLDANTLALLQSLGLDKLQIRTEPNGIRLAVNDRPLPGLAYDSRSLAAAQPLVAAFAPDAAPTLETVMPALQGAQIDLVVSFTGEPAGEMDLGVVPVVINDDGSLSAFGFPVPGGAVAPPDIVQKLQQAGVQSLNVDLSEAGLFIAANEQTLPTITWTPESLATLANVVAPAAGVSPDLISGALRLVDETGGLRANIALGDSAPSSAEINRTLSTPSTEGAPIIRLNANVQGGAIQSIEGLGDLAALGIGPIALPPNVMQILSQLNARQIGVNTDAGKVDINLDGNTALTVNWDEPSLQSALQLAGPFLAGTPLEDPTVAQFVREQIVPVVPGADVDVTLNLN